MSLQVLQEYFVTVTRKLHVDAVVARQLQARPGHRLGRPLDQDLLRAAGNAQERARARQAVGRRPRSGPVVSSSRAAL